MGFQNNDCKLPFPLQLPRTTRSQGGYMVPKDEPSLCYVICFTKVSGGSEKSLAFKAQVNTRYSKGNT